ncbi:MAG: hypothetical protein Terrestrivirus18_2 [Terrestrivirus sp.]|uniref:Uncharacterized protein n=1 Tax=Terrestrivirus sp. TaxID=2487775 RepID=A0A3G4ZT40_9VIRU|nr:MAG: hypothetical protein Terrestrivirus18_2 [Terrestrivirus sp.]
MSEYYNKSEYTIVKTKDGFIDIDPAVLTDLTLVIEYNGSFVNIDDDEIDQVMKENMDHNIGVFITNDQINKFIKHKIYENDIFLKMANRKIKIIDNIIEIPLLFFDICYISKHSSSEENKNSQCGFPLFLFGQTFTIRLDTRILDSINEEFDDNHTCYFRYRKHALDNSFIPDDYQLYVKNITYPPSSVKVDDKQAIFRPGMIIPLELLFFTENMDSNNYIKNNSIQKIEIFTEDGDIFVFEDTNNQIKSIKVCSTSFHTVSFNSPIYSKKLKNITITFYEKAKDWYCLSFIDRICYKNI